MAKEELPHKVYLATYDKAKYVMEIGEIIYKKKRDTYPKLMGQREGKEGAIKKCLDRQWIEDVTNSIKAPKEKTLGFDKRRYYKAKPDPLISLINERAEAELDDFEKYILIDKFTSPFFKKFVVYRETFDAIEYVLSLMEILFIAIDENINLRELNIKLSQGIETKEQYNKIKKNIKSNFRKLPEVKELFVASPDNTKGERINFVGGEKKESKEENPVSSSEKIEDFLAFLIIPDVLFYKIIGVSGIGQKYYELREMFRSFAGLAKLDATKLTGPT